MTDTPIVTEPGTEKVESTILQRIATPLFSFSAVLFLSLLASQTFLLPRLTTFRVGELDVSVDEAIAYESALRAEVLSLEDERTELVLPYIDDAHAALMKRKRGTPTVSQLRTLVAAAMEDAARDTGAGVFIDAVLFEAGTRAVTIRGRVEDPKPSSMSVLTAALDAVRALPEVRALAPVPLTREEIPGGYRSPFTFTFRLAE